MAALSAVCTSCGGDAVVDSKDRRALLKRYGRAYCSDDCKTAYRRKVSSETMARTNRVYASERMLERNPMRLDSAREKMSATLKSIGHKPAVQGGNGRGMTKPQEILFYAVGGIAEFVIHTKMPKGAGYPAHYKIDIAFPDKRLAIEVDGASHGSLLRQAQDRKKEDFLESKGWTVLRFTNKQIIADAWSCVEKIYAQVA